MFDSQNSGNEQYTHSAMRKPRTLTNHIGVSDIGGTKALLFYRSYTASLINWLAPLVWIRHPLYSSDWSWCYPIACVYIFKCMLGSAPRVGPLILLVVRPYSFLDVGLVFQAKQFY